MMQEFPRWIRQVIRWTSPGWYLFLAIMVVVVIVLGIYACFLPERDPYPPDHFSRQ